MVKEGAGIGVSVANGAYQVGVPAGLTTRSRRNYRHAQPLKLS